MSEDVVQPVVLDATVLSNFASSGTVDQIVTILKRPVAVAAVRRELKRGYEQEYEFLGDALDHLGDSITVLESSDRDDDTASKIRERLDAGEADSLLGAIEHGGTLATDDLAARRLATEHDVPVTGSIGLLVVGVRRDVVGVETANEWLSDWREKRGYYAPVDQIEDILD